MKEEDAAVFLAEKKIDYKKTKKGCEFKNEYNVKSEFDEKRKKDL